MGLIIDSKQIIKKMTEIIIPWDRFPRQTQNFPRPIINNPAHPNANSFLGLFEGKNKGSGSNSSSTESKGTGGGAGASILTSIFGALGQIAPILPAIGIGSKSRNSELNAQTQLLLAQQKNDNQTPSNTNTSNQTIYMMVGGGFLLLMVVLIFALKR